MSRSSSAAASSSPLAPHSPKRPCHGALHASHVCEPHEPHSTPRLVSLVGPRNAEHVALAQYSRSGVLNSIAFLLKVARSAIERNGVTSATGIGTPSQRGGKSDSSRVAARKRAHRHSAQYVCLSAQGTVMALCDATRSVQMTQGASSWARG